MARPKGKAIKRTFDFFTIAKGVKALFFNLSRVIIIPGPVRDITQPAVNPGEAFTYEFIAKNPGTFFYHCHVQPDA